MATADDHGDEQSRRQRFTSNLRGFLVFGAVVVIGALVAGVVFSRADPRRAAGMLIGEQVTTEPVGEATGPPAPTSGEPAGPPTCGVTAEPVDVQTQVDALAAGIVVIQYRDPDDAQAVVQVVADRLDEVLVAPNPELGAPIVATAWGRRLQLSAVDANLLRAFVTAHAGIGPDVTACVAEG